MTSTPPEQLPVVVDIEAPPPVVLDITAPPVVEVATAEQVVQVETTAAPVEVQVIPPAPVEVHLDTPAPVVIDVAAIGLPGPPGPAGVLIADQPPTDPTVLAHPYLRAELDPLDGRVVRLWLGVPDA